MKDPPVTTTLGECLIYDHWTLSRQVMLEHFTSFGFHCTLVDTFENLCNQDHAVDVIVSEFDDGDEDKKAKLLAVKARFKIALCRLRSPNEVKTEPGIDVIVSRHIKRNSLRHILDQLLASGTAVQPTTRHIPYF